MAKHYVIRVHRWSGDKALHILTLDSILNV
jgi:hypothetical protein